MNSITRENGLDALSILRLAVAKRPRITRIYIMRNLPDLSAFYGSLELPSIDNWLYYRFRPGDYRFGSSRARRKPRLAARHDGIY